MPGDRGHVGWMFWLWWVVASSIGLALGLAAGFAVGFAIGGTVSAIASQGLFGAVLGGSVGTMQWLVLRRRIRHAGWWVMASALGMGVGFLLVKVSTPTLSRIVGGGPLYGLVNGALVGMLVGTLECLVLHRQVSRAAWWVVASALGMGLGFALDQVVGQLVSVAVTGIALVLVLGQPTGEAQ